MGQRESRLSRNIQKALKEEFGRDLFIFKIHGGPMMMAGLPDLIGCFQGQAFGLETKMPEGGDPTVVQAHVHDRMRRAGAFIGVPRSIADASALLNAWFPYTDDD